ncbi:MAG: tRNA (adenosine(37)-N6)-dimethylallyltransferase MiaA [Ilumatobacteraceae bacterium]
MRVAIVGSTATGKSTVAMEVARRLGDVHLVSVDSMQVYRGMDIGTAKPSQAEQREVPHHCIDLVDPSQDFSVADFRTSYAAALESIGAVGARALLVGGTGLYHRVVVDEFDLPGEWVDLRLELEEEPDTAALHRRLAAVDPDAAAKIEPGNRRRVVRALEVTLGSGRPFSSFGPGVDAYPPSDVIQIGIRRPREVIAARVAERVHGMVAAGLFEEVERLAVAGFSRTAGQALGYKEILEHLAGRVSHDEAIEMIVTRTRQFAVRQERWFRRDPRVRWIDVGDEPASEAVSVVSDAFDATA